MLERCEPTQKATSAISSTRFQNKRAREAVGMKGNYRHLGVQWLLIMAVIFAGSGCMRSLPDHFELPPANPSAVKVQGMRLEEVWPHVLGRDLIEPEEIQKLSKWMLFEQQVTGHQ